MNAKSVKKPGRVSKSKPDESQDKSVLTVESSSFIFDEKKHLYTLDGSPLIGVTSVLEIIAKPSLIQWAANETVKYIRENCSWNQTEPGDGMYRVTEEDLNQAKTAHRRKKDDAASKGTDTHSIVENFVVQCLERYAGKPFAAYPDSIKPFAEWAQKNNVTFLAAEKRMYSKNYWFAGTCDLIFEMNWKRYIGDIKTNNAIYWPMFFQTAAYQLMHEEMYPDVSFDGNMIINLRKDGGFEVKESYAYETNKQAFLHALGLYKIINDLPTL